MSLRHRCKCVVETSRIVRHERRLRINWALSHFFRRHRTCTCRRSSSDAARKMANIDPHAEFSRKLPFQRRASTRQSVKNAGPECSAGDVANTRRPQRLARSNGSLREELAEMHEIINARPLDSMMAPPAGFSAGECALQREQSLQHALQAGPQRPPRRHQHKDPTFWF